MPKKKKVKRKQAEETVRHLFSLAKASKKMQVRYSLLGRKIAMRNRMRMPKDLRSRLCKHCKAFLRPGDNCRVRLAKGNVIYYCSACRRYMKFGISKKKVKA